MISGGKVIVGVSQSVPGLQALRFGVAEARRRGMPLLAVRSWFFVPATRAGSAVLWQHVIAAEARQYVSDAFAVALGDEPDDIDITIAVPNGRADIALKESASGEADLLVVGASANRWWPSRIVRGCTQGAPCPVIVVPPPELARALRRVSLRRLVHRAVEQQ